MKHVSGNWYFAGQFHSTSLSVIREAGIKVILNVRTGFAVKSRLMPIEEVTLLNIKDGTGTYRQGGRQSKSRLLQTRIDPNKPNEYISKDSEVNYQSINPLEYGDNLGYSESLEKLDVMKNGMRYIHTQTFIGMYIHIYYIYTRAR